MMDSSPVSIVIGSFLDTPQLCPLGRPSSEVRQDPLGPPLVVASSLPHHVVDEPPSFVRDREVLLRIDALDHPVHRRRDLWSRPILPATEEGATHNVGTCGEASQALWPGAWEPDTLGKTSLALVPEGAERAAHLRHLDRMRLVGAV